MLRYHTFSGGIGKSYLGRNCGCDASQCGQPNGRHRGSLLTPPQLKHRSARKSRILRYKRTTGEPRWCVMLLLRRHFTHRVHADFLESQSIPDTTLTGAPTRRVPVATLWAALIEGLSSIWPSRLSLGGVSLGDVWPCDALKASAKTEGDELVPFHKLTGWTTYSLLEPMEKILGWKFEGVEDMTGLPEYRNGMDLVS